MKYVILKKDELELPLLFLDPVLHKDAVGPEQEAVSAGFFEVEQGKVSVSGESTSLGLKAREQDAWLIQYALTHMGFFNQTHERN